MQSIDADLKKLFEKLMSLPVLNEFFHVGGTNLAMRYNHRHSVDIDLFRTKEFDVSYSQSLNSQLKQIFESDIVTRQVGAVGILNQNRNIEIGI